MGDRFASAEERNKALHEAAAADANHDFHGVRGQGALVDRLKETIRGILGGGNDTISFKGLWNEGGRFRDIGTGAQPTGIKDEWGTFEAITGLKRDSIIGSEGGALTTLSILGGDAGIQYEWAAYHIGSKGGEDYEWRMSSKALFEAIVGSEDEKSLYFLIDAVNVKFYDALAADEGATQKIAFSVQCRESNNDAAGKPNLGHLVRKTARGHTVRIEEVFDEYDFKITYPPFATADAAPFDSVYTVTLESSKATRTREGLQTVVTKFTHPEHSPEPVIIQKGSREEAHPNAVNSIFPALARIYARLRGARPAAEAKFDYWTLLQKKRSGDWLQALSCLDAERYLAIPKGSPIFLCTEDIICAAYALAIGVNVIFTYHYGTPAKYCIAVFRRPRAVLSEQAQLALTLEQKRPWERPAVGTLLFDEAVEVYQKFRSELAETGATAELRRLIDAIPFGLAATLERRPPRGFLAGIFADRARFNEGIRKLLMEVQVLLNLESTFPPLRSDSGQFVDLLKGVFDRLSAGEELGDDALATARTALKHFEQTTALLKSFAPAGAATSAAAFKEKLEEQAGAARRSAQYYATRASKDFDFMQPFSMLPRLGLFQELDTTGSESLKRAVLPFFERLLAAIDDAKRRVGPAGNRPIEMLHDAYRKVAYIALKSVAEPVADSEGAAGDLLEGVLAADMAVEPEPGRFMVFNRILVLTVQDGSSDAAEVDAALTAVAGAKRGRGGEDEEGSARQRARGEQTGGATARASGSRGRSSRRRSRSRSRSRSRARAGKRRTHPILLLWFFIRELLFRVESAEAGAAELPLRILHVINSWFEAASGLLANEFAEVPPKEFYLAFFGCLEAILFAGEPEMDAQVCKHLRCSQDDLSEVRGTFLVGLLGGEPVLAPLGRVLHHPFFQTIAAAGIRAIGPAPAERTLVETATRLYMNVPGLLGRIETPPVAPSGRRASGSRTKRVSKVFTKQQTSSRRLSKRTSTRRASTRRTSTRRQSQRA